MNILRLRKGNERLGKRGDLWAPVVRISEYISFEVPHTGDEDMVVVRIASGEYTHWYMSGLSSVDVLPLLPKVKALPCCFPGQT